MQVPSLFSDEAVYGKPNIEQEALFPTNNRTAVHIWKYTMSAPKSQIYR